MLVVSLYAARKEETSEDYFLAGRGLNWWLIGFSLIAANISTGIFPDGVNKVLVTMLYVFCLFGFAKNGIMPFHHWLPGAMVAPTPVSALIHAAILDMDFAISLYLEEGKREKKETMERIAREQ